MLTAEPISELKVESAVYAVFAEWLAQYFDGGAHAVGGNAAVLFPRAVIQFGQSPAVQPLNPARAAEPQASLLMVWGAPLSTQRLWEMVDGQAQWMIYKRVRWRFWVRAEVASGLTNARKLCRETAEKLSAILTNPATTVELNQKGIFHLRANEPEPVSETGYILMQVACQALLRYPVKQ